MTSACTLFYIYIASINVYICVYCVTVSISVDLWKAKINYNYENMLLDITDEQWCIHKRVVECEGSALWH
jgi:hypothetical protein